MVGLRTLLASSVLLRGCLLLYGLYQDAHSLLKYTDVDYYVFTDASRFVSLSHSPYERETYRYTPLLAWLLLPTTWSPQWFWFSFGKVVFAAGDLIAGWLIYQVLRNGGMEAGRASRYASIWLLNPMVAAISTRGSSEGLLGVLVVGLVWAVDRRKTLVAGVLLGLAVHLKIYPVVYAPSIIWWLERQEEGKEGTRWVEAAVGFVNRERVVFGVAAMATFLGLNWCMYQRYEFTPSPKHRDGRELTVGKAMANRSSYTPTSTI
jgi:phosphatidylinositol glycan class M